MLSLQVWYLAMMVLLIMLYTGNLSSRSRTWNIVATCIFFIVAFAFTYITFSVVAPASV